MDAYFALLDFDANVGRRRRKSTQWVRINPQTEVIIYSIIKFQFYITNKNCRLLNWIHSRIPEAPINNFTTDWTSGKAVGALVDACAPGLCPDWDLWDPKDAVQNASEAMGLADDYLNVRQLIKPEELVNPNVDEQSMMTYLSQYPNAKLKPGAPLRPKTNPNR